jgi:hypothetical protein
MYKIEFNTIIFNWVYTVVITTQFRICCNKHIIRNLIYSDLMAKLQKKSLDSSPDETQTFEDGKMELAKFDDITIGRVLLEPGWSWEKSIIPIVKTDTCQSPPHNTIHYFR